MINFNLNFATNKNGFTPSQEQQNAMNLAATTWGKMFDHDVTIDLLVESVNNPNSDTLMSAADSIPTNIKEGFNGSEVVRPKVLTGVDNNGSQNDGVVEVNWGINWELDINETPDTSVAGQEEFDFYSTFYHEISHTLGFLSSIQKDGRDADGEGITTAGAWTFFDQFITDSQGNPIIDPETFQADAERYVPLSTGGSSADGMSGLFFNGTNAVAANNNKPVGLFSPAEFDISSSLSHLDDDNPAFEGFLTLAEVDFGPAARTLAPVEKAIFEDLGYQFVSSETADPTDPMLKPSEDGALLDIIDLGDANTIRFQLDQVEVDKTSEFRIFTVDSSGNTQSLLASFSLLDNGQLAEAYAPQIILDDADIEVGQSLIFEIFEGGESRFATLNAVDNGRVTLDFGRGTVIEVDTANEEATTNLLSEGAESIDLSAQTGDVTVEMSVFREAAFDSTIGFYTVDAEDGGIVIDSITGDTLRPGDAGYKEAALDRQIDTQLTGKNGTVSNFSAQLEGGDRLGMFLIADGNDPATDEVFFSYGSANANGDDHVKQLGSNLFGFEDLAGLGDRDYNDMVVQLEVL